jgi:serine/threonine-protein phosphatase 4 catalytic subunit
MIDRKQEVPHDGAMCDLLWSDPDGNFNYNFKFHSKWLLIYIEIIYEFRY